MSSLWSKLSSRRVRWCAAALCLLAVCWVGLIRLWPRQRLNLLLVTLDTTRADRLGCYGYAAARTPTLDALADRGVLIEQAYTVVPLTLPSHATMFTGLTPREHGIHDNGAGRLSSEPPVLADILRSQGYDTGAFVGSYVLNAKFGLDRGFETYDDDLSGGGYADHDVHRRRDGQLVVDQALEWLQHRTAKPFFCWVHLFDAHAPYKPRENVFGEQFQDRPYDAGIAYADQQIKRILDHLATRGLDQNTLVVIVGDHGEGLGEHAEREHGHMLYNSTLHVPLIISHPQLARQGSRIPTGVSLTDLFPTMLDCLAIKQSAAQALRSFRPALLGQPIAARACYAETDAPLTAHGAAPQRSVLIDAWKYIRSPQPELYHVAKDPGETQNLVDREPQKQHELDELISKWETNSVATGPGEVRLSDAEQRRLASLGYVGGKAPSNKSGKPLPDIKERIVCHNQLTDATDLFRAGQAQQAVAAVEKLLARTPDYFPAQIFLGEALRNSGRPAEAEAVYRRILSTETHEPEAGLKLGMVLAQQDRNDEALAQLRKVLQSNPESAECHLQTGIVLKNQKAYQEAYREMTTALELDPESPDAHYQFAILLTALGQPAQALAEYRVAVRYAPDWAAPHSEIAVMLGQQNNLADAVAYATEAMQLEPKNADYQYNLGIMYVAQGKLDSAIGPLSEAVRLRPDHPHAAEQLQRARASLDGKNQ